MSRLQDAEAFLALHYDKLVCIDEVQLRPDLFPLLRALIDDHPRPGRFLILGSSSPDLLRQSSETLAGRLSHVYITPFLQRELLQAEWQPKDWRTMLWRGGFPRSFLASTDARSCRWRESYVQAFVERDLRRFGVELNPQYMRRLWLMCCHLHGQLMNYSALGLSLDVTHPTVKRHIDVFEAAFMMRRLPPFAVNTKKRLVKSPKLYVRDSGLLTSLAGGEQLRDVVRPSGLWRLLGGLCGREHPVDAAAAGNVRLLQDPRRRRRSTWWWSRRGGAWGSSSGRHRALRLTRGNRTAAEILDLDRLFVVVPQGNAYPIEGDRVWVAPLEEIDRHL